MTPEQIDAVRVRWALALRHPDALVAAIDEAMAGPAEATTGCTRWAVDAITRLVLVLDRPTAFPSVAETGHASRPRITLHELDLVRDALLATLRRLTGEMDPAEEHAWALAFALFRELVLAHHLHPFTFTTPTNDRRDPRPDIGEPKP